MRNESRFDEYNFVENTKCKQAKRLVAHRTFFWQKGIKERGREGLKIQWIASRIIRMNGLSNIFGISDSKSHFDFIDLVIWSCVRIFLLSHRSLRSFAFAFMGMARIICEYVDLFACEHQTRHAMTIFVCQPARPKLCALSVEQLYTYWYRRRTFSMTKKNIFCLRPSFIVRIHFFARATGFSSAFDVFSSCLNTVSSFCELLWACARDIARSSSHRWCLCFRSCAVRLNSSRYFPASKIPFVIQIQLGKKRKEKKINKYEKAKKRRKNWANSAAIHWIRM